jgi:hypothetical protein
LKPLSAYPAEAERLAVAVTSLHISQAGAAGSKSGRNMNAGL